MAQASSPLIDVEWTDEQFRAHLSDLDGVIGAPGGSAYAITLPASGNDVTLAVGSARVAGFLHQNTADELFTIPVASGATRTDIIVIRYDPAWPTAGAKPCRLYRVVGPAGGAVPAIDLGPPGVQELPLWQITRTPGLALNASTARDLRRWSLRRTASHSVAPPTGPTLGEEWLQTDTGKVLGWNGAGWRLIRTVRAHRQARPITLSYTASVAAGRINFPEPFDSTPDHVSIQPGSITNNTPVTATTFGVDANGFNYIAWAAGSGTYNGTTVGSWKAEIL